METESILYKEDNGWKILIHDRQQTPVIDIRTHGSTLHNGWGKDIRIYIRQVNLVYTQYLSKFTFFTNQQFETLNTWNHPCSKEGKYSLCIADCFVKTAAASMSCRLPFMDGKHISSSKPFGSKPVCKLFDRLLNVEFSFTD